MRVGNPLPVSSLTIQISGIAASRLASTIASTPVSSGAPVTIAATAAQTNITIQNLDTVLPIFVRDTAATTGSVGVRVGALSAASIDTRSGVNVTNPSATTVNFSGLVSTL